MIRQTLICLVAAAFAFSTRADDDTRTLRENLLEVEQQIQRFLRLIPLEFDAAQTRQRLETIARASNIDLRLGEATKIEQPLLPNGRNSALALDAIDLMATGRAADLGYFLSRLRYIPQLVRVETLRMTANGKGVDLTTRLLFPRYVDRELTALPSGDFAAKLRYELEDRRQVRDTFATFAARPQSDQIVGILSHLSEAAGSVPFAIHEVRFTDALTIQGIVTGAAARAALDSAVKSSGLLNPRFEMKESGHRACRSFTITAKLPGAPDPIEEEPSLTVVPDDLFDARSACGGPSNERAPSALKIEGKQKAGLDLQLHGASIADIFYVLADLTGSDFFVDSSLRSRVTINASAATAEEIIEAMKESVKVSGDDELRRVSAPAATPFRSGEKYTGEPVSLLLTDADLQDVLCLFSSISGLEIHSPADLKTTISIYATEVAWDRAFVELLGANGLRYKIDGTRVLVAADPDNPQQPLSNACTTAAARPTYSRIDLVKLDQLDATDLELAGVGRKGEQWKAYVLLPSGKLMAVEKGTAIFGGAIQTIDSKGLTATSGQTATTVKLR